MVAVVEFGCQVSWEYKRGKLEVMWDWWFFQWFQKKNESVFIPRLVTNTLVSYKISGDFLRPIFENVSNPNSKHLEYFSNQTIGCADRNFLGIAKGKQGEKSGPPYWLVIFEQFIHSISTGQ